MVLLAYIQMVPTHDVAQNRQCVYLKLDYLEDSILSNCCQDTRKLLGIYGFCQTYFSFNAKLVWPAYIMYVYIMFRLSFWTFPFIWLILQMRQGLCFWYVYHRYILRILTSQFPPYLLHPFLAREYSIYTSPTIYRDEWSYIFSPTFGIIR